MTREPEWSREEFAVLLASSEIDAAELAKTDLPSRSPDAIKVVRQGILMLDGGKDTHGILSRMMVQFLEKRPRLLAWAADQFR